MNVHMTFGLEPKMDQAVAVLAAHARASIPRRQEELSALQTLAKWSGVSLKDMPANVTYLRIAFDRLEPAALGVSSKRFANVKSLCLSALKKSELVDGIFGDRGKRRPKTPEWAELWDKLRVPSQQNALSRLVNYCNRTDIPPQQVNTKAIEQIMADMERTSLRPNQHRVHRAMAKVWNQIVDVFPDKGLQKVAVPPSRLKRTRVPIEQLSQSFVKEWHEYETWAQGDDVFADDARPRRLKQSTLDIMFRRLHHAVSLLVETGAEVSSIRGLADLAKIDTFKTILRKLHEKAQGKPSYENFFAARTIIQVVEDMSKVDPEILAELKRLAKHLPQPIFQMTRKNKHLVTQFDDPNLQKRFLTAPDRIWQEVLVSQRRPSWRLAEAQAALGLHILMFMPVRLGNLTNLEFEEHIVLRETGPSTLHLSEEETKTGAPVEFNIPQQLASRLLHYRDQIAPSVIGFRPKSLFINVDGSVKGFAAVRDLAQRYLKQYVGIHMNPHAFRHLAAKFILDKRPDAHVLVQHLLGHKKLETTVRYYAGLDTKRAGRHHQALLEKAMAEYQADLAKAQAARRRH